MNKFSRYFPMATLMVFLSFNDGRIPLEKVTILACIIVIVFEAILLMLNTNRTDDLGKNRKYLTIRLLLTVLNVIPILSVFTSKEYDYFYFVYRYYYAAMSFGIMCFLPYVISEFQKNQNEE
ncbi:hypothetical protein [Spirochaeta dissipatitropha]